MSNSDSPKAGTTNGAVADAARDLLPADVEFRVQAADRQRAVIGILNVELDRKILLQQIAAAHFDAHHGDVRAG